jgi:hypothetical protein
MQCACAILSSATSSPLLCFFTLSHKLYDFRKKLLNIKRVFQFSVQFWSETFLILKRTERDMIKMFIDLRVK